MRLTTGGRHHRGSRPDAGGPRQPPTKEEDRVKRRSWLAALAVVLGAALATTVFAGAGFSRTASPQARKATTIDVLSLWGGSEKDAFIKVTDAFTKKTGIKVQYETARDFIPAIRTRLAAGNPPDVAIVPRPGYLATLAKDNAFKNLSTMGFTSSYMKSRYTGGWISLGTVGGKLYGLAVKANSKSVIWYRPDSFKKYHFKIPTKHLRPHGGHREIRQPVRGQAEVHGCVGHQRAAADDVDPERQVHRGRRRAGRTRPELQLRDCAGVRIEPAGPALYGGRLRRRDRDRTGEPESEAREDDRVLPVGDDRPEAGQPPDRRR
ncbi:MAG: extracellular solute-binding protein [Actinobacteria bacterium]|nr:MAG: extracellular solute-binding protein [Actinomycetota bacterium]